MLRQDAGPFSASTFFPYLTNSNSTGIRPSTDWVFVATPGTHTYTLVVTTSGTAGALTPYTPSLIATTYPFGATGNPGATAIEPDPQPAAKP